MKLLDKILPKQRNNRYWFSVALTVVLSGLLTLWAIYGIRDYGVALFILTPVFIGLCSAGLYGYKQYTTRKESLKIAMVSLAILVFLLIVLAIEGVICIVMVSPIALLLAWIGSLIGHALAQKKPGRTLSVILVLITLIPVTGFVEQKQEPELTSVTSSIEIAADPMQVWEQVIAFPQLADPTEFIFKTGIAYPINASIEGRGVGAVRHCNFTTGSFVEPVTVWEEGKLLAFDVAEQPAPMKELSFWDIDAPHLHDYFVSKKGQFKLTRLPNGHTLLEGTTWYYHRIKPAIYWQQWSNMIIHKIHNRVLTHIKTITERGQ